MLSVRERETETETERQRDRETERDRDREQKRWETKMSGLNSLCLRPEPRTEWGVFSVS